MTVGQLRKAIEHLDPWTPVYAQCKINLDIVGTSEQTVSGFDDGTPMLALHLDTDAVRELVKVLTKKK